MLLAKLHRVKMYGNRSLIKVFWPKRDEVRGNWKRQLIEELYDQYPSPNMTRVIKSIKT
jgi:hypothetical protein